MAPMVFFDLETTGLNTNICHLTQLSAICGQKLFNVYVLPRISIDEEASRITGLTLSDGTLCHHGNPVETSYIVDALTSFIDFLRPCDRPLLVAHNARGFDMRVLTRLMRRFDLLQDLQAVVSGYVDTLPLSRELHPDLPSHSLHKLVSSFVGGSFEAHNAVEDARKLQEVFMVWNPSAEVISKFTSNVDE